MNRERLARWCERAVLFLVLAVLVFGPLAFGAVRTQEFLVVQSLVILAAVFWLIRIWLTPDPKIFWPPIAWAVVAFLVYAIARYLTAEIEYVARRELIRVAIYALLFFIIINNFQGRDSTRLITLSLVFLAMGISAYAIFQFALKSDRVWHFVSHYPGRASGTYICPNHLAGFLEMIFPIALAYVVVGRFRSVGRIFIGYAALVIICGIVVTISRGGWAGATIALTVFFLLLLGQRNFRVQAIIAIAIVGGAAVLFAPTAFRSRVKAERLYTETYNENVRFELWRPTARMWRDHFWFGVGPGHFDYRFRQYRPENIQAPPVYAHNDFLNTLADWGTAGGALIASVLAALTWGLLKTWRAVRNTNSLAAVQSNKFAFVLGASVGLLAIVVHSTVDFNMQIPANAILAVTIMALLTAHLRFATGRYSKTVAMLPQSLATVVFLGGCVYLTREGWRTGCESLWLRRAEQQLLFSDARMTALKNAFSADSKNFETVYQIAEDLRKEAFEGNVGYERSAQEALVWYGRGIKLNPYASYNHLFYGVCLDLLERFGESEQYFRRAEELDPNGYFTMAYIGRHYVEAGDFAAALPYFERSWRLQWEENPIAESHIEIVNRRLAERAQGEQKLPF